MDGSESEIAVSKKKPSRSLQKRLSLQRRLGRHIYHQRFNGRSSAIDSAPIRDATARKLVLSALFRANNDTYVSISAGASTLICANATEQTVQSLVSARDSWLAQNDRKGLEDAGLQSLVERSIVRAPHLERHIKLKWAETDPVGFDSCALFDEIVQLVDSEASEVAKCEKKKAARAVSDRKSNDRARIVELEQREDTEEGACKKDRLTLQTLKLVKIHDDVAGFKSKLARVKKSIVNSESAILSLRTQILPRANDELLILEGCERGSKKHALEESTKQEARTEVTRQLLVKSKQNILDLGRDLANIMDEDEQNIANEQIEVEHAKLKEHRLLLVKQIKETKRLEKRAEFLTRRCKIVAESLPAKEARIALHEGRTTRNQCLLAQLEGKIQEDEDAIARAQSL